MAQPNTVTKIYKLSTLGFDVVDKQLTAIERGFVNIKKAKQSAEGKLLNTSDTAEIKKFSDEIAKLKIQEQQLRVERQKMINEQKAANIARQEEIRIQKEKLKGNNAEAGSIAAIRLQIRELNAALIQKNQKGTGLVNFQGQNLSIDQAVAKLKELTAAEQDFRRTFSRDSLLVGEYTSGIVQAFKAMGLDDLVGGQVTRSQERLNSLKTAFDLLQKELQETKAAGQSTETIEKQMIENRNEVIKLESELTRLKTDLRGTGDVGNQITTAIGNGFKTLKGQVAGFALGFVGITAVFNKLTSFASGAVTEFEEAETSVAKFSASLANAGRENEFDELSSEIDALAKKFQFLDNDAIRNATEKLVVFGKVSKDQIKQLLPVIIDFATRQRIGLEEATSVIIKGLEGQSRALKDYGLDLKEGGNDTERFGIIVNDLGNKIKGTAENFQKLSTGQLAKNRQAFKDLQEELGKRLVPALTAIGTAILFLITNLPTIATLVGILAAGWAVANTQLILQNAQLLYYNLLIVRNYIALGILSAAQLVYNSALLVFNGVLKVVTAGLRLFGVTATTASGPLGIILTILGLLGGAFLGLSKAMGNAAEKIDENTKRLRALNQVNADARNIYSEQIAKINSWIAVIKSGATSADTKKRAVDELIKTNARFSSVIKDNVIDLKELEKAYGDVTAAIKLQAKAQASASLTAQAQQRANQLAIARQELEIAKTKGTGLSVVSTGGLFGKGEASRIPKEIQEILANLQGADVTKNIDLSKNINISSENIDTALKDLATKEKEATDDFVEFVKIQEKSDKELESFINNQTANKTLFQVDIKKLRDQIEKLDKDINDFQGSKADLQKKITERNKLQKQLDALLGKKEPGGTDRGSRLTGEQKDAFKDIDALRDKEIADEKIRLQTQEINEERFHKNILAINQDAIDKKLKLLKGSSAEERKQIAELNLEKITQEQETNKKIFDLNSKILKDQLDAEIANIKLRQAAIDNDPTISETDRAQAKLDSDNEILNLQVQFNTQIDALEKQLAQTSLNNAEESADAIRKTKEEILQDDKALSEARLKDIESDGNKEIAKITANFAKLRQAIIDNDKLTATQRKRALEKLDAQEHFTILSSELKRLTKEFREIKAQYNAGLKSEEEFLNKKADLEKKKADTKAAKKDLSISGIDLPSSNSAQKFLSERLSKSFGFTEGSAEAELLGETISQTFSIATDAMNSYFDAERDRINENLRLNLERLDMQQKQVEARAQSQAEIESIEKQFEAKRKKAQQQAGEELKRVKKSEAKIALATELANIWSTAFQLGPVAGAIAGAVLSGLALTRYALRISEINSQKFARGGVPVETGGKVIGPSHAHGGVPFEAEGGELAILTKKTAGDKRIRTITGTPMQIASLLNELGGGISFASGAKIKKFASGGVLGGQLQPPVFPNSGSTIIQTSISKDDMKEIMDEVKDEFRNVADEQSKRIDRLEVVQVTNSVTEAQKKDVKQSSVGRL